MKNARTTEAVTSAKFHADDIPLHDAQQDLFPVEFEVRKRLANHPSNPRHIRVAKALLACRGLWRFEVDDIAGCANGPQLMADIGHKNIHWICTRLERVDRDGRTCKPGFYELTPAGRELIASRLDKRKVA